MRRLASLIATVWATAVPGPAAAAMTTDCPESSITMNSVGCTMSSDDVISNVASSAGTGVRYQVRLQCLSQDGSGICNNPRTCAVPPNTLRYDVLRSEDGGPFVKVGEVCLGDEEAGEVGVITIGMVTRAFRELSWSPSPLVVQPPGGRTLVNFATNFSTTNTDAYVQTVTLLGQRVDIEGTPTSWVWHYGDGATQTTDSPGATYPDLEITHTYLDAGVVATPRVDTVYAGRFRINGGPWQEIPETLTVRGSPVDLEIVEARPVLVGSG